jgi:hypothetical protein
MTTLSRIAEQSSDRAVRNATAYQPTVSAVAAVGNKPTRDRMAFSPLEQTAIRFKLGSTGHAATPQIW